MNSRIQKISWKSSLSLKDKVRTFSTKPNELNENGGNKCAAEKMQKMVEKLRQKTPIGKLDEIEGKHPFQEKEPLSPYPDGINPNTGEKGGPKGPEPTRYGDWERKGRVSDF